MSGEFIKDPKIQSPEWRRIYNACLKEFPVWEFGIEAKIIAQKTADKLFKEDQEKETK